MPLSTSKKVATGVAAAAVTGLLIVGGASLASAAGETPSAGSGTSSSSGQSGDHAPHEHTPVTGDEATKVSAAVTAKDSAVTVSDVQKDPDGSYDVNGTKAGAEVHFDVSADLATITERTGGRGGLGGHGGGRGSDDTPVTGDEATKVSAAVTAKDSAVTVSGVRKDPDGSYDVDGTKAGAEVHFDVSADLATIIERTGGQGGRGGHGGGRGPSDRSSDDSSDSSSSSPSSSSGTDAQQSSYATTSA